MGLQDQWLSPVETPDDLDSMAMKRPAKTNATRITPNLPSAEMSVGFTASWALSGIPAQGTSIKEFLSQKEDYIDDGAICPPICKECVAAIMGKKSSQRRTL